MSAALDTTIKTSTEHVVDLVQSQRTGIMVAVCRCNHVLLRMSLATPQAERAARLKRAMADHLRACFTIFLCLFCSVMWSCVMSNYPAIKISISQLANMSDAQRRAMDRAAMGLPPEPAPAKPARPAPRHIEIDDIPNAAQAALVSISFDPISKAVTARLKKSSVVFGRQEFTLLRELGLAARKTDTIYHRLTDDGKGYAVLIAKRIAQELGLHEIWHEGAERYGHSTAHCTCGYSTRLYSGRAGAARDHNHRIARHLAEASGAARPGFVALGDAIQKITDKFGGTG